jgi:hypothetical protein
MQSAWDQAFEDNVLALVPPATPNQEEKARKNRVKIDLSPRSARDGGGRSGKKKGGSEDDAGRHAVFEREKDRAQARILNHFVQLPYPDLPHREVASARPKTSSSASRPRMQQQNQRRGLDDDGRGVRHHALHREQDARNRQDNDDGDDGEEGERYQRMESSRPHTAPDSHHNHRHPHRSHGAGGGGVVVVGGGIAVGGGARGGAGAGQSAASARGEDAPRGRVHVSPGQVRGPWASMTEAGTPGDAETRNRYNITLKEWKEMRETLGFTAEGEAPQPDQDSEEGFSFSKKDTMYKGLKPFIEATETRDVTLPPADIVNTINVPGVGMEGTLLDLFRPKDEQLSSVSALQHAPKNTKVYRVGTKEFVEDDTFENPETHEQIMEKLRSLHSKKSAPVAVTSRENPAKAAALARKQELEREKMLLETISKRDEARRNRRKSVIIALVETKRRASRDEQAVGPSGTSPRDATAAGAAAAGGAWGQVEPGGIMAHDIAEAALLDDRGFEQKLSGLVISGYDGPVENIISSEPFLQYIDFKQFRTENEALVAKLGLKPKLPSESPSQQQQPTQPRGIKKKC